MFFSVIEECLYWNTKSNWTRGILLWHRFMYGNYLSIQTAPAEIGVNEILITEGILRKVAITSVYSKQDSSLDILINELCNRYLVTEITVKKWDMKRYLSYIRSYTLIYYINNFIYILILILMEIPIQVIITAI